MSFNLRYGNEKDFDRLLQLDSLVYPIEWQVTKSFVLTAWKKNPYIYRVLEYKDKIYGFIAFFPLDDASFEQFIKKEIQETDLCHLIIPYGENKSVNIYVANIIVDKKHPLRKKFAKALINEISIELQRIESHGSFVKEICAVAITSNGKRVLNKSNLLYINHYSNDTDTFLYRGTTF